MPRPLSVLLALAALPVLAPSASAETGSWRWPVRGALMDRYRYDERTPFLRGQRRGIVIAAPAGAPVRSACDGRVTFGGAVAHAGGIVSVRCGGLTASYLRLAAVSVRRGESVATGDRLGVLGARGLHLGVRREGRRWAYVDPLSLLGDRTAPVSVPPLPSGREVRRPLGPAPVAQRAPRPEPLRAVRRSPAPGTAPAGIPRTAPVASARPGVPALAWLGLGLLLVALPGWGVRAGRRRRAEPRGAGVLEGAPLRVR